jgi:serpin B
MSSFAAWWFFIKPKNNNQGGEPKKADIDYNLTGNFDIDLFKKTFENSPGNTVVSPLSVKMAMAMAGEGADEETLEEFYKILEIDSNSKEEFKALLDDVSSQKDVTFNIANSVWGRDDREFNKDFLGILTNYYKAEAKTLDFSDSKSKDIINAWVKAKTNGKIEKIVDRISEDHLMFIINAIYFNGSWTKEFDAEDTEKEDFALNNGSKIKHDLMYSSDEFNYYEDDNTQAIELPYGEDGRFVMRVYLPKDGKKIEDFVSKLSLDELNNNKSKFGKKEGQLKLPKFKTEFSVSFKDILQNLGFNRSFDKKEANFGKMIKISSDYNVYIGDVKHKTYIDVSEEGTEAAAVTSVEMAEITAMPGPDEDKFEMFVNRPFFFTIEDTKKESIIFIGTILDPSK